MFGQGRGRGYGFGFRGSDLEWPYIGRGRGGLPRCGAYIGDYGLQRIGGFSRNYSKSDELNNLKLYAESLKKEMDRVNERIAELEKLLK